jgi:hypothetical protein
MTTAHTFNGSASLEGTAAPQAQPLPAPSVPAPVEGGIVLGSVERRYGLLTCEENVRVIATYERVGDLAVADRIAYVMALRHHVQVAVFEYEGWYCIGSLDRHVAPGQASDIRPFGESPRLLSIVSERGVEPVVGPLA